MNLFQRLRARRRNRQFQLFREWLQLHEQAKQWTSIICPRCLAPASSPGANYCIECGLSLRPQELSEKHTDPALSVHPVSPIRERAFNRAITTDTLHVAVPPRGEYRG